MQRLISLLALLSVTAAGQTPAAIGGIWTLNRSASNIPREIGFNAPWLQAQPSGGGDTTPASGRGGRRGSGGGGRSAGPAFSPPRESYDDARRVQFLTGEARNPATRLTIVDTPDAITITNEFGQSRALHVTGRDESIEVSGVPLVVATKRDADTIVVTYTVDRDRQVRYTYTPGSNLVVDIQFLDHGKGDTARLVYAAGLPSETAAAPAPAAGQTSQPATPTPAGTDTRPGAELRGLKAMGILVEDLGPQATACGLSHDAIETALARRLTDAGFTVHRNSDEDTYLYVNIQTSTVGGGTCVSRYDAFLYTHATATLSYREHPALVQVSLIHRGGIGNSAPTSHAPAVTRALEGYVDMMVSQIRDANQ